MAQRSSYDCVRSGDWGPRPLLVNAIDKAVEAAALRLCDSSPDYHLSPPPPLLSTYRNLDETNHVKFMDEKHTVLRWRSDCQRRSSSPLWGRGLARPGGFVLHTLGAPHPSTKLQRNVTVLNNDELL